MRAARFHVAGELLRQLLHMPDTACFVEARVKNVDVVEFVCFDESLPESTRPHEAIPTVRRDGDEYTWDWGLS